jgi:hypothetical protein
MGSRLKVFLVGFVDVHEGLGVAIHEGEPGVLHLDHHAVAGLEGVGHVGDGEGHARDFARREGFRAFEAIAVAPAQDVAAHQHLVAAHGHLPGVGGVARQLVGKHVDELHHVVGIGAGGAHPEVDLQRPGEGDAFGEYVRLVDHHIGPAGGEALVVGHVLAGAAQVHVFGIGHGAVGVGDVLVVAGARDRRWCKRQATTGLQVEARFGGFCRWPVAERVPFVAAGDEDGRFRPIFFALAPEVVVEEGQLHILVLFGGIEAPVHVAQVFGYATGPLPVVPGAHEQEVVGTGRVLLLNGRVHGQRAKGVLGIEPAAHGQHGRRHLGEMGARVAGLPEFIVVGVAHQVFPEGDGVAEILVVDVLDRAHLQEEVVVILRGIVVAAGPFARGFRPRLAEAGVEGKGIHEEKGAAVVKVVADEPVGDRRLGRNGPQGGMGLGQRHGRVEARVGNAEDAHAAVVVGHVLHEPVDGIVGVAVLVKVLGPGFVGNEGAHVHEGAFALVLAAHILESDDVAGLNQLDHGAEPAGVLVGRGLSIIGRPPEQDGGGCRSVIGQVVGSEQPGAVAHGDVGLVLGPQRVGPGVGSLSGRSQRRGARDDSQRLCLPHKSRLRQAIVKIFFSIRGYTPGVLPQVSNQKKSSTMATSENKEHPAFLEYVYQLNAGTELTEALQLSLQAIDDLDITQLNRIGLKTYEEGKWTIHTILQHLIDWERIWCFRAILFARGEGTIPVAHDQEVMGQNSNADELSLEQLVHELRVVRQSTILMFASFNQKILATNCRFFEYEMPLSAIGLTITAHQIHHFKVIKERYLPLDQ